MNTLKQTIKVVVDKKSAETAAKARLVSAEADAVSSFESLIQAACKWFANIAELSDLAQSLPDEQRIAQANEVAGHFRKFHEESFPEIETLKQFESRGFRIAGAEEFIDCVAEAKICGFESERILRSIAKLDAGLKVELGEAMNGLRGRSGG